MIDHVGRGAPKTVVNYVQQIGRPLLYLALVLNLLGRLQRRRESVLRPGRGQRC